LSDFDNTKLFYDYCNFLEEIYFNWKSLWLKIIKEWED